MRVMIDGGMLANSGFDGREHPAYPNTFHGGWLN